MNKLLKLFFTANGVNNAPFPNADNQIEISDFTYDAQRMGDAPSITATVKYQSCLDSVWTDNVYAEFNGEKYYLKQTPTSSYSNEEALYSHSVELVSERIILNDVYFYDAVKVDTTNDKPLSNSSDVTFFGNISEFVSRLNMSLVYAGLQKNTGGTIEGYNVMIDDVDALSTEGKLMSFKDQFFSNVLQEMYNVYEIPYYFVGKTIHIGFGTNQIQTPFRYGVDDALLSITKENAGNKIVNRCTGIGSSENLPYYYPNQTEKGTFTLEADTSNNGIKTGDIFISSKTKYAENLSIGDALKYVATPNEFLSGVLYETGGSYASYPPSGLTLNIAPNSTMEVNVRIEVKFAYNGVHELRLNLTRDGNAIYVADYVDIFELKSADGKYAGTMSATKDTSNTTTLLKSKRCQAADDPYYVEFTMKLHHHSNTSGGNTNRFQLRGATNNKSYKWKRERENQLYDIEELGLRLSSTPRQGDKINVIDNGRIITQNNLMPSIYRRSKGAERFYNAENNTHPTGELDDDGNPLYFNFENTYNEHNPKEQIVSFEDIKPTITGMTNSNGLRMDMFSEFAYDVNDSDETVEIDGSLQYKHPYFFGKLRKFDGEHGFNLFDHAIESGEMTISFTSGSCGGCQFVIAVSEDEQKNIVQVDENGNLKRDVNGDVLCGKEHFQPSQTPQARQNDTFNNEVWVALRKDDSTFGNLMPVGNLKPKACTKNNDGTYENDGDSFVITNIDLPLGYVTAAEERLEKEIIAYMANNNSEKFNFAIKFSRIYLAENPKILEQLNENATLLIEYNDKTYPLYVSSFKYKASATDALPEITVELTDTITIVENSVQNAINAVKQDILSRVGNIDWLKVGMQYFLRKDIDDTTPNTLGVADLTVANAIKSNNFIAGLLGAGFYLGNNAPNNSHLVVDTAEIRKRLTFNSLEIKHVEHVGGELILSPAGAKIDRVGLKAGETAYSFDGVDDNMYVVPDTSTIVTDSISGIYWLSRKKLFAALYNGRYCTKFVVDDVVNYKNYMSGNNVRTNVQFRYGDKYYVYDVDTGELIDVYRCYFKASEDEISVVNNFKVDDLVKCQTFNLSSEKQRYYWRRVVAVGADYIDLSTSDCDTSVTNDVPMAGDNIVTIGNKSIAERQNAIVISSYDEFAPSITMYQGINTFDLPQSKMPVRISPTLGNKFTGDFYIQTTANDGTQQVMSLAEFLGDRINLGVYSALSGEESAGEVSNPTPKTHSIYLNDNAKKWRKGDIIDIQLRIKNSSPLNAPVVTVQSNEAFEPKFSIYKQAIINKAPAIGSSTYGTVSIATSMKADWNENYSEFINSFIEVTSTSNIELSSVSIKKRNIEDSLKRTGIDIEKGSITLDAQTTTIKDGNKTLAIFTTDDNGNAKLSTELIEVKNLKAEQLETSGVKNSDGKIGQRISIQQNNLEVYDEKNELKVKIHGGKLDSSSYEETVLSYNQKSTTLQPDTDSVAVDLFGSFNAESQKAVYSFGSIGGQFYIKLDTSDVGTGESAGAYLYRISATLYRGNNQNDGISDMEEVVSFGDTNWVEFGNALTGNIPNTNNYFNFKFDSKAMSLAKGFYRIIVRFSTKARHTAETVATVYGNNVAVKMTEIVALQEIATDGYHFQYSTGGVTKHHKADASGFEVMYGKKGIKINEDGALVTQDGITWASIGGGGSGGSGGGDTPSVVVPSISINASVGDGTTATGDATVEVTRTGGNTAPSFAFAFDNLRGAKGDKGDTGATGSKGDKGDKGDKGIPGVKGDTGVGISSIVVDYAQMGVSDTPNASTSWSTAMPRPDAGKVIWTRFTIKKTDLTTTTAYTKAYQGENGESTDVGNNIHVPRFGGISDIEDVSWATIGAVESSYSNIYYFSKFKIFAYRVLTLPKPTLYPIFNGDGFDYLDYQDGGHQGASIHKDKLYQRDGTNEIYCWKDDTNGLVLIGGGNAPTKTSELTNDSGFITASDNIASATKLQTMRYINGSPFDGTTNVVSYAVCTTAAATTTKTVSISRFILATGSQVRVKFSNANTASAPTLNVGSTGAKRMSYKGSLITNANFSFSTAKIYTFTYDGTYWVLEGDWDEVPKINFLTCEFMGEVGEIIWSSNNTNQIAIIHDWMNKLSEGKVSILESDEDIYAITYALNYSSDETYGSDKARFSYIFDGYLYEVEYNEVSSPVTLTIVSKTKIGGSNEVVVPDITANAVMLNPGSLPTVLDVTVAKTDNDAVNFAFTFPDLKGKDGSDAEVGVMPMGNGSYDYIPIYTIVNMPATNPNPIYRTRNGETLKSAVGGLMYLTLNNVAVSQPIPISVANGSSQQIVPVMLSSRALSISGNTTWAQYYIDIRITTFNGVITPRILALYNSNMASVALSSTQLDSCKLIGTIYGVFG